MQPGRYSAMQIATRSSLAGEPTVQFRQEHLLKVPIGRLDRRDTLQP